jgi:hypothetical protein
MRQTKTHHHHASVDRRSTNTEAEERVDPGFGRPPRTELGWLVLAARRAYLEREGRLLTRDELERELAELKGEVASDDED